MSTDFQMRIGYVDVKSSPVYFYVQRKAHFNTPKTPIPFDSEILNIGGAMNLTSGKFTGWNLFIFVHRIGESSCVFIKRSS